jgi:outer membrane lipoprotein SlyB
MQVKIRVLPLAGAAGLAAVLAGCAVPPYGPNYYYPASTANPYGAPPPPATYGNAAPAPAGAVEYGRITNVALISNGTPVVTGNDPAGTVIGGIVGGVLGHQIGAGGGQGAATVLGALGGAVAGSYLAGGSRVYNTGGPIYRIWVQTDSGVLRTFDVHSMGNLRAGDRVRIENGLIYLS